MGGPDKLYTPQMTAEGTVGFGDLTPYKLDVDYIGQAWHATPNGLYNDTINFTIGKSGKKAVALTAFSISQIGGAYGDDGQNYYNIINLLSSIDFDSDIKIENADGSCPKAAAPSV